MISVRDAKESDAEKFLEYQFSTPNNLFDPASGLYPTSFTLVAENGEKPIVFSPVQVPYMAESLGISQTASNKEIAVSLRWIMNELVDRAKTEGRGEIYFFCSDETTSAFAEKHGFEKIPFPVYRLRVKDYPNG